MSTTPKSQHKVTTRSGMRSETNIKPPQKLKSKAKVDGVEDGKTPPPTTSTDEVIQSSKSGYVCCICKNVESIRTSRLKLETDLLNSVTENFSEIKSNIIDNISSIENFDLHLAHLLVEIDPKNIKSTHTSVSEINKMCSKIQTDIDSLSNVISKQSKLMSDSTKKFGSNPEELTKLLDKKLGNIHKDIKLNQCNTEVISKSIGVLNSSMSEIKTSSQDTGYSTNPEAIEQLISKTLVSELKDVCKSHEFNINNVRDDIRKVETSISELKKSDHYSSENSQPLVCSYPQSDQPIKVPKVEHKETPIAGYDINYINQSEINSIVSALSDCTFRQERGHSVCAFGEDYKYNGSKAANHEFPGPIKALVDKLNSQFYDSNEKINSCLVNRYSGDKACLPEHSDNESSIDPESDIYTISIGADASIVYKDIINGKEIVQGCENGSLYKMSRNSQNFFTHRINECDMGTEIRYSLTFRVVGWRFKNSTCIIGDSNTGKLKFGVGQGTFGYVMPGKRVWAATIDEIDPICCSSYTNVVVLCGINNIKSKHIRNCNDVKELYTSLKHKVDEIRLFNKKAHIFVCPLLPTKSSELNKRALDFNRYILRDLCQSCPGVSLVLGFDEFLDQDGYLARDFSFTGDHLHLNMAGARHLADLIKASISFKKGGSGRIMKKPYSSAVSEGTGGALCSYDKHT